MNLGQHLMRFYARAARDVRIRQPHLSLYMALLVLGQGVTFAVKREEVMLYARISSRVTYHRCMLDLAAWEYIEYSPSYDPSSRSQVFVKP